jgi:hypothetical protein
MPLPGFTADASLARIVGRYPAMWSRAEQSMAGTVQPQQPPPAPGCWFAGTNCYGFIQTLKFCCNDGTEYTQRWGWCIGVWFAPPCLPPRF